MGVSISPWSVVSLPARAEEALSVPKISNSIYRSITQWVNIYYFGRVLTQAIVCIFLVSVIIQLGYLLFWYSRLFTVAANTRENDIQPVSVIVCARNEAENLGKNLPSVLRQRYMNAPGKKAYEVIVVDDASTDDTPQVLYTLSQQYDNLWSVTIPPDAVRTSPGKKFALAKGLEAASNDLILMMDADCIPASELWLAKMVAPLNERKTLSIGIGKYERRNGWLNAFIRWETMHTVSQYAAYTLQGKPYMAVGRNLAATRAAITTAQQSDAWNALPSGDDDLLVTASANGYNTALVFEKDAFTLSPAKRSIASYMKQKQRHLSTGKYYKAGTRLALAAYAITHALLWLSFFALLWVGQWEFALTGLAGRCIPYYMYWQFVAGKMDEQFSWMGYLLSDIGWLVYNFAFSPYIIWKNKKQWT